MENKILNIGAFIEKSYVNGPGARAVIWLQGCKKRCPGCINPQFWDMNPRNLVSPHELARKILSIPYIEGVTYSGGEPFLQAKGLYTLSKILKEKGMSVVCYSGYTYEEIINAQNKDWVNLLSQVDILIDGEFIKENRQPLLWRSSSNQKVYFLSKKYRDFASRVDKIWQNFEIHINDGGVILTGFIDEEMEKIFLKDLNEVLVKNV